MAYIDLVNAEIRLEILLALFQDMGYSANDSILQRILASRGLKCGRDCVRTQIAWLAEQGLVTYQEEGGMYIVKITLRGADVAQGNCMVPGVKRPDPS